MRRERVLTSSLPLRLGRVRNRCWTIGAAVNWGRAFTAVVSRDKSRSAVRKNGVEGFSFVVSSRQSASGGFAGGSQWHCRSVSANCKLQIGEVMGEWRRFRQLVKDCVHLRPPITCDPSVACLLAPSQKHLANECESRQREGEGVACEVIFWQILLAAAGSRSSSCPLRNLRLQWPRAQTGFALVA